MACIENSAEAARITGLPEGVAVAVGNVDAHVTAPAAAAVDPGQMVAIMGTSTCHVMNADVLREVPGMCGVVDGGIVSGLWGYEAGQSGVGDIFGWFTQHGVPASYAEAAEAAGESLHEHLTRLAAELTGPNPDPAGGVREIACVESAKATTASAIWRTATSPSPTSPIRRSRLRWRCRGRPCS